MEILISFIHTLGCGSHQRQKYPMLSLAEQTPAVGLAPRDYPMLVPS